MLQKYVPFPPGNQAGIFIRVLIYSSGGPIVWLSKTICAILVEGITGNIPVNLF